MAGCRVFSGVRKILSPNSLQRVSSTRFSSSSVVAQRRLEPADADSFLDIGIRNIFTEEHDMLRTTARRFAREVLQPNERSWGERGYPDREVFKEAGRLGLNGIDCPVEEHGQGGDFVMSSVLIEECCYANCGFISSLGIQNDICIPYFKHFGTREQKDKYLPKMISGEWVIAIAMTEPGTGSDLQGIRTSAKPDGDDWILNGSKTFITNGYNCDVAIIVARTATDKPGAQSLTLFLVEKDMPGFSKGKPLKKLGMHASDTAELFLDDVRVPADNVLGGVNKGFFRLLFTLPSERLVAGNLALSFGEYMFELTKEHVKQRKAFGGHLSDLQTIQHSLAAMKTDICATRAFIDNCAVAAADSTLTAVAASMAKVKGTDVANDVGYKAIQLHGGMGYMDECEVGRAAMTVRAISIYAGANEVLMDLVGRDLTKRK